MHGGRKFRTVLVWRVGKSVPPVLLYVIPVLALVVIGGSLLITATGSELRFARLMGGPTDAPAGFSGRVQVLAGSRGTVKPVPNTTVRISAKQGGHESVRTVKTGEEGWAEFSLTRKVGEPLALRVTGAEGQELARGTPELPKKRWAETARSRGGRMLRAQDNGLGARVSVPRGVLSVPFSDEVLVHVEKGRRGVSGATVRLTGDAAKIEGKDSCKTDEKGVCRFLVRPEHHTSIVVAEVELAETKLKWEQLLPIVPGALAITVGEDDITVRSPIERDFAWYTWLSKDARHGGGRLSLRPDGRGGAVGSLARTDFSRTDGAYLLVSSDADGRTPATVGYPLGPAGQTFDAIDGYLLDGAPVARARLDRRATKLRWILGGYTGLSFLLTLVLFVGRIRRDNAELAQGLDRVGAKKGTQDERPMPLLIAAFSLFFAFSAAVVWIVAR